MSNRRVFQKRILKLVSYPLIVFISILLLFPVVLTLINSLMSTREILHVYGSVISQSPNNVKWIKIRLIPETVSFMQYYNVLLRKPKFLVMFWNSVILCTPIVVGQLFISCFAAYAFSKIKFPFRNKIFFFYIVIMMMPFQVTLVPNYIIMSNIHLIGTRLSVILPGIFSTFGVFLLRQFMVSIPDEYSESAKIDGATHMRILIHIIIPQCKNALSSLVILLFVDNWNMVEQPLVLLKDENMYPLSIFMSKINSADFGLAFSCAFLYMMPSLLVFLYGENYLVQGIQLSGIK